MFLGYAVDGVDNVGCEWHVDDDVQTTFEAIYQPRDLAGEARDTRGFFSVGQRGFLNNHWTVGTDKMIDDQSLGHAVAPKGGYRVAELIDVGHYVGVGEQALDLLELGRSVWLERRRTFEFVRSDSRYDREHRESET